MTFSQISMPGLESVLFEHLWQSTAVVLAAWLLTFLLRTNSARVRYLIWLIASIKFLVPFRLLTSLGAHWAQPVLPHTARRTYMIVEEFARQFQPNPIAAPAVQVPAVSGHPLLLSAWAFAGAVWLCGCCVLLARWISDWRHTARLVRTARPVEAGSEFDALCRAQRRADNTKTITLRLSPSEIEPGIFGIFRPTLLWPADLTERLDETQIMAIMTHEVEHVRRRDNLTCGIHALVEAIFWFHPLVRWMSKKMTEERERACDETVMQLNTRPEAYAESILKVCSFCLEPPAACVSGISGADLKERILRIMTRRSGVALNFTKKLVLSAAGISMIVLPVGFGVVHGQSSASSGSASPQASAATENLPKYDVASIKPYKADDGRMMMMFTPDGVSLHGLPLREVLQHAFGVEQDRIIGEPAWVQSNRYDIEAKVEPDDAPKLQNLKMEQRNAMMLQLLVDRFGLKYHHEKRELPMYALVVAKGGLKMKPTKPDQGEPDPDAPAPGDPPKTGSDGRPKMGRHMMMMNPGHLESTGASTDMLAHILSRQLGRTVVDKTGLAGEYDFALDYTPEDMPMPMHGGPEGGPKPETPADQGKPSIFTALEEQMGLKLESTKSSVDVIVIDHIDLPTEN